MHRATTLAPLLLLLLGCAARAPSGILEGAIELALVLPAGAAATIASPEDLAVSLTNTSPGTIRILAPGDGSLAGGRSPVIGWSALPASSTAARPAQPVDNGLRCGNVNPLQVEEVLELPPGSTVTFRNWIAPYDLEPGRYRLAFYYRNEPTIELQGLPLGPHDPQALELLRSSTPCEAWSPEVVVTIE